MIFRCLKIWFNLQIFFLHITAELGRALAVVKVTLQVNGNTQFLGVCPQKTIGAMKTKFGTNDYVGEFFFNVMLIFEQGYSEDRWTDFNAQYLKTRVSAGSAYL